MVLLFLRLFFESVFLLFFLFAEDGNCKKADKNLII